MKKLYILVCAAVAGILASCSNDPAPGNPTGEEVNYTIGVVAGSRYDMGKGGLGNVSAEDYSIRYILEAYTPSGNLVSRFERFGDIGDAAGTTFNVGLVAQQFKLVVWADFVPKTEASGAERDLKVDPAYARDLYYDTKSGLKSVALIAEEYGRAVDAAKGGRMVRDAYCGFTTADLRNEDERIGSIELKRPFTRVELYSTVDLAQSAAEPKSVKMIYPAGEIHTAYNALAGDVIAESVNNEEVSYVDNLTESFAEGSQLVTFDYLFAPATGGTVSLQAKFYPEENGGGAALEWGVNAIYKELKRNYILEISGDVIGGLTNIDALIAAAEEGGTVVLPAGDYQTTLNFAKSVKISGPEVSTIEEPAVRIYSNKINKLGLLTPEPESDYAKGGVQGWEGRFPLILIDATNAAEQVEVTFENVTISAKDVPYDEYWGMDGVTVYGNAKVTFNNVVFEDFIRPELDLQDQYGRCITVGDGAEVVATRCLFRKFNKNAVDVLPGGKATLTGCIVEGQGYTVDQAVGKKAAQNGFVFRYTATGQVSNCFFRNLQYNKGVTNSNAVYLYNISDEANVTKGAVDNTVYDNCDANWTVVKYVAP